MDKVKRSITIDKDVDEYLSQPEINASGLINTLLLEEMQPGENNG